MNCALLLDDDERIHPSAEVDAFLRSNSRAYVFVTSGTGEVRGWPLSSYYRTGLLFFTTYAKSVKVSYFNWAKTATVLVATPENATPLRYCEISGQIRIVPFAPEVVDRFLDHVSPDTAQVDPRVGAKRRVSFRDRVEKGKRVLIEVDVVRARIDELASGVRA